ncbi:Pimeloyl-ACP methyl ester carboxylesterase [Haladaptatus litoreus]|uniref:Pimeloyl-ACP methyl ester carboxylesterase n=1 Tax=Haladaptatus litoreus TaxID=553468 RepID=A0A1N7EGT3_9EURY|nr:alpha/beta hydrolase [Haladaptatus litoreus]SIR87270.1 Pimeloyl-ACP methyl ester carboxylesterase [Haladaptatus litoreus]
MAEATPPDSGGETETVTSADGTTIAFERTGSGPPLVLVHGVTDVHEFWDLTGVRSAFAEHFTVYALDRRGRGESGDAVEYELDREAEDVVAVVDSIDDPVILLGHSGGALYSLEAALRTDNLRKLIVNEPPIQVSEHELEVEEVVAEMKQLLDDGENEQALMLFLQAEAHLTPDEIDVARSAPIWQDMVDAAHTLPREWQAIAEYEFNPARFADLTTPTLVSGGGESPSFYKNATDAVTEALPNSRLIRFDGQSHEPMNTAPDRFTEEILMFIRDSN